MLDLVSFLSDRPPRSVEYDWKAYYDEFARLHGPPVQVDNWLYFPDGWRYNALDYRGPEVGPTEGNCYRLVRLYWYQRRKNTLYELRQLREMRKEMHRSQRERSATLQFTTAVWDGDKKTYRELVGTWAELAVDERIEMLEADLAECEGNLTPQEA